MLTIERRMLYRLIYRRFGEVQTEQAATLLACLDDPEQLADISEWVIDCETGEQLLERLKQRVDAMDS